MQIEYSIDPDNSTPWYLERFIISLWSSSYRGSAVVPCKCTPWQLLCIIILFNTFFLCNLCYWRLSFSLTRPEILPRIGDHVVVRSHLTGKSLGEWKAQWFYRILHVLLGSLNNTMTIVVKTLLKNINLHPYKFFCIYLDPLSLSKCRAFLMELNS